MLGFWLSIIRVIRFICKTYKSFTTGKAKAPLAFLPFRENLKLGVCNCIDEYMERTNKYRKQENQLLISFIRPHKALVPKQFPDG